MSYIVSQRVYNFLWKVLTFYFVNYKKWIDQGVKDETVMNNS